jgi:2'-5' RNA ligase
MTSAADRVRDFRFGVFVLPLLEPLGGQVEALRRQFDPTSAALAPPHISVTQPLAEEPNDIARADLGALIAEFAPFEVRVGPARAFADSAVVYLAVEPAAAILALRSAAHATGLFRVDLPDTDDFVPHVTIREWPDSAAPNNAVISAADAAIGRAVVRCDAVELWRPDRSGRFSRVDRVALLG